MEFHDPRAQQTYETYLDLRKILGIKKPITLMDMAIIGAKALKQQGKLEKLDESDEINACTVKTTITVDGEQQDWLVLFKNETHNHPTEIEPFGGAATCIGGAIRDPLSGRAFVYQAMRLTGAADPQETVCRDSARQAPGKKDRHHRCRGLQLLRQPDWTCDRARGRDPIHDGFHLQAHGDRCGGRRGAKGKCAAGNARCRATS